MENLSQESSSIPDFTSDDLEEALSDNNSQQSHAPNINYPKNNQNRSDQRLKDITDKTNNNIKSSANEESAEILLPRSKRRLYSDLAEDLETTKNQDENLIMSSRRQRRRLNLEESKSEVDLEDFDLDQIRNRQSQNSIQIDLDQVSQQLDNKNTSQQQQAPRDPRRINSNTFNYNPQSRQNIQNCSHQTIGGHNHSHNSNNQGSRGSRKSSNHQSEERIQQEEQNQDLVGENDPRFSLRKRRLNRLQEKVQDNRKSLAKLEPQQQEKMCTICQCEMELQDQATIESCIHVFCFVCIKEWATKAENTCPLCKQKFNKISYTDEKGDLKILPIENKRQRIEENEVYVIDEDSDDVCYVCGLEDNPEQMIICDLCDYHVAHTYCCGFGNRIPEGDWLCGYCTGLVSDSDEPDSSVGEISEEELEYLSGNRQAQNNNQRNRLLQLLNLVPDHDVHIGGVFSNIFGGQRQTRNTRNNNQRSNRSSRYNLRNSNSNQQVPQQQQNANRNNNGRRAAAQSNNNYNNQNQQRQQQVTEMIQPRNTNRQQQQQNQQQSNPPPQQNSRRVLRRVVSEDSSSSSSSEDSGRAAANGRGRGAVANQRPQNQASTVQNPGQDEMNRILRNMNEFSYNQRQQQQQATSSNRQQQPAANASMNSSSSSSTSQVATRSNRRLTRALSQSMEIPQRQVVNQEGSVRTPEELKAFIHQFASGLLNVIQTGSNSVNDVSIQLTVDRREQSALEQATAEANNRNALSQSQQSNNNNTNVRRGRSNNRQNTNANNANQRIQSQAPPATQRTLRGGSRRQQNRPYFGEFSDDEESEENLINITTARQANVVGPRTIISSSTSNISVQINSNHLTINVNAARSNNVVEETSDNDSDDSDDDDDDSDDEDDSDADSDNEEESSSQNDSSSQSDVSPSVDQSSYPSSQSSSASQALARSLGSFNQITGFGLANNKNRRR